MRLHHAAKRVASDLNSLTENELCHLQSILLIILDDIIQICNENNLHFILIGGSAIGALRHKGFIPWDDDIDIAMERKDFEKFAKILNKDFFEKYSILHPQTRNNSGRIIPKIRLKETEYRTLLEKDLDDCGIFIDIYIIENVFDNDIFMYFQGIMSMGLGFALACRRIYRGRHEFKHLCNDISFKIRCFIGFCLSFISIERWAQWTDFWHSICKNSMSKRISIPSDGKHFFGGLHKRKEMCEFVEIFFEGRRCYLPKGYDSYLRGIYRDYMKIPPIEKRVRSGYLVYNPGKYYNKV